MKVVKFNWFALLVVIGGAIARPGNKIVGGDEVTIEEYPYQVSLQFFGSHYCGASIIGKRMIITAAHCTEGILPKYLSVRVGSTYHQSGGDLIIVSEVRQHKNFNTLTMDNDISILILERDIVFSESTQPISLPDDGQQFPEGTTGFVSGWGSLWANGPTPEHLHGVTMPIVSKEKCQSAYPNIPITDNMLCAGYIGVGGMDSCQGDSGGPLQAYGKLIGIVSWGDKCADPKHPGVYANVATLRTFIKENTGI